MVRRVYVEKKKGNDFEAEQILNDLRNNLLIGGLKDVRILKRYDVSGITDEEYVSAKNTIFSEPMVDICYDENVDISDADRSFALELLPGQYDQRADSAAQCIQILTEGNKPLVRAAKVIALYGSISDDEYKSIKNYLINPVEAREAAAEKPATLEMDANIPDDVKFAEGFIELDRGGLEQMIASFGFAMDIDDITLCQSYFKSEGRNPSVTELRMIDTYWSDHCRHTTFLTRLENVDIEDDFIKEVYNGYLSDRGVLYKNKTKDICLMDIATIAAKELTRQGYMQDFDKSEEINACSIVVRADIDGETEDYLVMFKNETHNHPTEIEPFGGAATCLGGAIRDPLSGRSYVYQAMRITGCADPRTPTSETLSGKLPQKKITQGAAAGYSSYGNQIGLATGHVEEVYHPSYVAKRMEMGAVIAAVPKANVVRTEPQPDDIVVLLGGRTGRDGCGGATGSSKAHTEKSLESCGAEVQKGNPTEERKIQRLFRNGEVSRMIKRCNDFGAGGVSVAIGELADGLYIDLDRVPKKYEGLDGTELAISESQERMAVVIAAQNKDRFFELAKAENLEATVVATVTKEKRLVMTWRGKKIVDISRDFLNTNGATKTADAHVEKVTEIDNLTECVKADGKTTEEKWYSVLSDLNVCSQKGLSERFDSTIGAGSVFMPFGGKYQRTPSDCMVAKLPVLNQKTTTGTVMSHGYNPYLSEKSPFHGAIYAVCESVSKAVAAGAKYSDIYLSFQEFFGRPGTDSKKWGKPLAALLGAYHAQKGLCIGAIGGKDSMSGTFNDIDVPPTLVSVAVAKIDVSKAVSGELKKAGSNLYLLEMPKTDFETPDFEGYKANLDFLHALIMEGRVLSSKAVRGGGICEAVSKMAFGNRIGVQLYTDDVFSADFGSIIFETDEEILFENATLIGKTIEKAVIKTPEVEIDLAKADEVWSGTLEKVFPEKTQDKDVKVENFVSSKPCIITSNEKFAKPTVFVPVFPGTNCEYDTERAFVRAGANVEVRIIRNLSSADITESIDEMERVIKKSQIIMIPGGFSGGDEPDGSGKFIATAFRNPKIRESVMQLLYKRDGLMLGICNGFQALIKLGLVPFGEIRDMEDENPTLTFNTIGRHMSSIVNTKVSSCMSPWLSLSNVGDVHSVAISHGEGRFVCSDEMLKKLAENGQIATQYVDFDGNATMNMPFNPNGSVGAVEGITSPDGRVLGKMGHSERIGDYVHKNIYGEKDQKIFEAGVKYFK